MDPIYARVYCQQRMQRISDPDPFGILTAAPETMDITMTAETLYEIGLVLHGGPDEEYRRILVYNLEVCVTKLRSCPRLADRVWRELESFRDGPYSAHEGFTDIIERLQSCLSN